jgi:hypothetical protein
MSGKMQVAVSFENDQVKVVEALEREGSIAITAVHSLSQPDLALYLQNSKAEQFSVACDFPELIHDILHIPPAKKEYLQALVQREVRKRFPEVQNPSVAFHTLREQTKDGRKVLEVMVYIVEKARLDEIVTIFEAKGKRVSLLYPAILPIARLVHASLEQKDEILLTVIDGGTTKTLLVSQGGQILFLRVIQSRAYGIDEIDADNINMTVTYSRQTLRAEPARCIILGDLEQGDGEDIQNRLLLPVHHLGLPPAVLLAAQTDQDNIYSAVALLLSSTDLHWASMVPSAHTAFFRKKNLLKYGAMFFFCSSLILSAYSVTALVEVPGLKAQIRTIRADMSRRQSLWSEWVKASDELNAFMPLITFSNGVESSPHTVSALRTLSFLPISDIKIRTLHFSTSPEGIKVEIKGELTADRYGDMSKVYQGFLSELKRSGDLEIRSHSLEVKTRALVVEGLLRQGEIPSDG